MYTRALQGSHHACPRTIPFLMLARVAVDSIWLVSSCASRAAVASDDAPSSGLALPPSTPSLSTPLRRSMDSSTVDSVSYSSRKSSTKAGSAEVARGLFDCLGAAALSALRL